MGFRTPLKTNVIHQPQSYQICNSNSSTRLSSIKKVMNSDKQVETYRKNRSVTFQNSLSNANIKNFNNESLSHIENQHKLQMKSLNEKQNENLRVNSAIKEIVQNASDQKYYIYQNQIDRQKQPSFNLFHTQNLSQKKKQHCPNDLACSHNHIELNKIQVNQKPSKRELGEYNYEQTQKMILQDQLSSEKLCAYITKTPEKTINSCLEEHKIQNMNEEEIQQNLLNSARAISSKTFLKIQANMKPHPVLISYCLSFIYIYEDYLQISDCKLKKLENNWREIQDVFQHHAPLIQALDSIGTQIQQQRINKDNISKSKEQIQKAELLIDTIKNTQIYSDIVMPIQNFIKQCENAINFYSRKYDIKNSNCQENQRESNKNIKFNKLDQIVNIQQKIPKFQSNFQNDQMRRNTYANINQSQESGENQIGDDLREFTLDLSPIQQQHSQKQINQFSLQKQLTQQSLKLNETHQRRQSENIFNTSSQHNEHINFKLNQNFNPSLNQIFNPQSSQNLNKYQNEYLKNKINQNENSQLNDNDAEQATYPLDQLQMDYYKKIKKYIKRMEEIEKIKEELWKI
ncbi:hypothetical protein ABPG72_015694 [Tetrahymena utriculariae]